MIRRDTMIDRSATLIAGAAAETDRLAILGNPGHVGADRPLDRDRQIRLDLIRRGARPAEADLLAEDECERQRHRRRLLGEPPRGLDQHRAAGAIVERLAGHVAVVELDERVVDRERVSDPDPQVRRLLARGGPDVDEHVLDLDRRRAGLLWG